LLQCACDNTPKMARYTDELIFRSFFVNSAFSNFLLAGTTSSHVLPALVVELVVRLVQQLEHRALGPLLIAPRDLFPELHQAREILDRMEAGFNSVRIRLSCGPSKAFTRLMPRPSRRL